MSAIGIVARREIRERLKARSFRIGTLISVGVVVAAIVIPSLRGDDVTSYDVAIVRAEPAQVQAVLALQGPLDATMGVTEIASIDRGQEGLRSGDFDAVMAGDEILVSRKPEGGSPLVTALETVIRLQRLGPEAAAALTAPVTVRGVKPPEADSQQRFTAFLGVFILFVFLQQYGTWVLMGVVEEKTSRVVEVLLAAVRPRQLVSGKVIGIGSVALAQGVIVAGAAIVAALATGTTIFEGTSRYSIVWTLVWFALGYGLYAWAYAAVGSMVSRQEDAQNAAFPMIIPVLVGYMGASTLLSGGDPSPFVRVLSFVPATAPMVMPMLIGIGEAPAWHIAASMIIVVGSIALLMRLAGDIYSRAILHSGQRLRLRQVLRGDFTAA